MNLRCSCIIILIFLVSACSGAQTPSVDEAEELSGVDAGTIHDSQAGSCGMGLTAADAHEAIRAVLNAEGTLVVEQNIDGLMNLWAEASRIADAKNTPDTDADDQIWQNKDAIRHRYVRIVFPGAPSVAQPSDLKIRIDGNRAVVVATTNIGDEVSPQGDQWELIKEGGCWLISSLTYNLESKD